MLFNSLEFLIFFPTVVIIYFLLNVKLRSLFLLTASYYFYMNWMPVYAFLIFASTLTTYYTAILISTKSTKNKRRIYLVLNLMFNLGILFTFKYFNFINDSIFSIFEMFGLRWKVPNLELLLPVGISFYTFQAIGYTIDVYKGKVNAENNFITYALFVSFFPQLVAGPIERAKNLLPQFHKKYKFNFQRFLEGSRQMLWGYFMKVCVADRLAIYVNAVYNNTDKHNGTTFWIATILFAFQIYCDFAGYSNIAIGASRIMGYNLMDNFKRPYFATSIREFWSRWHISLSTWFRDYVYIPLGGNRVSSRKHYLNLFITFLLSGIWHGASWTFVIWGSFHGLLIICEVALKKWMNNFQKKIMIKMRYFTSSLSLLLTFFLVNISWVFFRADTGVDSINILTQMFSALETPFINKTELLYGSICLLILLVKEVKDELKLNIKLLSSDNLWIRGASYIIAIYIIILFGVVDSNQFIYFQF